MTNYHDCFRLSDGEIVVGRLYHCSWIKNWLNPITDPRIEMTSQEMIDAGMKPQNYYVKDIHGWTVLIDCVDLHKINQEVKK